MADAVMTVPETVFEGQELPEHICGPIDRTILALFAGASHDHVKLHIDSDFAKGAGMDDVFAHGMLVMAYLGQFLTRWRPQQNIRKWSTRFVAITPVHATIHCRGRIAEIIEQDGERLARVKLGAWTDKDVQTVDGEALVALG
ncbi:MaoC/PaaZ C-terminal domain-containing protein [Rhizorhabdus dicambivorans]|nr:MaoC/PaaZ C-terminal domain-containing protein [Rhizorhabdus dicambivorans]